MLKLEGKTALVTGGNSGIGLAIARRFAAEGARVFITGRRQAQLDAAVADIGPAATAIAADLTLKADIERMNATLAQHLGRLDILVYSAGVAEFSNLADTTGEHLERSFGLNVFGMVQTVAGALPLMQEGGSIVLVGSIAGSMANPGYGTYSATKAAVRSYARTWTVELAPRGIRVNTLSPGPTDTPMFDAVSLDVRETMSARSPRKRFAQPDEVADAALFLASDDSRFVGGVELTVDGGLSA